MREISQYRWTNFLIRGPLLCLPVIATWLFIGIMQHHERWAVFSVAGAVSASFGAFQKLGRSRTVPTILLLGGISLATWLGNVAGYFGWYDWVILATICGFAFGAMTALGYGGWWLGLQWMIGLLVYGSHFAGPSQGAKDAFAVAIGGASQALFIAAITPWAGKWFRHQEQAPWNPVDSPIQTVLHSITLHNFAGQYALRVALAMVISTLIAHFWSMPNSYWVPMTAAILLKPDFHEATLRGVSRLIGTLTGAGLLTIILALAKPAPLALGCLLLLAIWLCLALLRVNYALFVACITAYVVLLFAVLKLPEPIIALHRVEATIAGAAIALIVSLIPFQTMLRQ